MSGVRFTLLLSSVLVSVYCHETTAPQSLTHRHRHARSHIGDYDLDRLLNRLDNHLPATTKATPTTQKPPHFDVRLVTEPNVEPGNSLWDEETVVSSPKPWGLNSDRWTKILKKGEEKRMEGVEDSEDGTEETEEDEDEEESKGLTHQADSSRSWSTRNSDYYTNWKVENLGTRKSVDNLFQVYYRSGLLKPGSTDKDSQAQLEAYRHNKNMVRETMCKVPRPKVIKVGDVYPSTSKLYVPACTVLYQCGEDTGCCGGSSQRCGPKTSDRIELYFHVTYVVSSGHRQRASSGLEKLPFYNHTECECQDHMEEVMPRDGQGIDTRPERMSEQGCRCPSEYTVRRLANGSCTCDCFDKQRDCIKYKRGKEYFSHSDRLCVEMGTCQLPACDFGVYIRSSGRCPRKHEKFRTWSRYH